jgi:glycosyltransferase involved in cell wall biosynthesis
MFLSIVIPAYNEEARLPGTLERVRHYIERRRAQRAAEQAEILVVNDGSRDRTAEVARQFYADAGPGVAVRLLENPGNKGKGYSVRHGMLEAQGDWILFSDADLSAPIEECDKLLAAAQSGGFDVAIGSRALDRSLIGVHQSLFRENAGRVFNALMRLATGLPFHDTQCGFKLFRRSAAREIFSRQRLERFGFDVEVLYLGHKLGFRAIEVPVRWNHSEGTKVSMVGDSLDMFLDLWRVRRFDRTGLYEAPPGGVTSDPDSQTASARVVSEGSAPGPAAPVGVSGDAPGGSGPHGRAGAKE